MGKVTDEMIEWMDKHPTYTSFSTMEEAKVATYEDFNRLKRPSRINDRGNKVYPGAQHSERYLYDFKICTPAKGWKQFDTSQDASYFGVWVHMEEMLIFTYCEGDITLVVCSSKVNFKAELDDAVQFYGAPPPAFITYSFDETNEVTRAEYYDTRPSVSEEGDWSTAEVAVVRTI